MSDITLPATPDEAHEALSAITAKVLRAGAAGRDDEARTWLARHDELEAAACARWPGEGFEPYEPDEDDKACCVATPNLPAGRPSWPSDNP